MTWAEDPGKMVQQLKVHTAPAEDRECVPSTHTRQLSTAYSSSSRHPKPLSDLQGTALKRTNPHPDNARTHNCLKIHLCLGCVYKWPTTMLAQQSP